MIVFFFFFQSEDGIRDLIVTGVQTCALPIFLASTRRFARHGQCGQWVSDLYPEVAKIVDDLCLVQSCTADGLTHVAACTQANTGSILLGHPSLGAWSIYGLGSETEDLPGFIVLSDAPAEPPGGPSNWGTGFMPAAFQGTWLAPGPQPILNIAPSTDIGEARQRGELAYLQRLNQRYAQNRS